MAKLTRIAIPVRADGSLSPDAIPHIEAALDSAAAEGADALTLQLMTGGGKSCAASDIDRRDIASLAARITDCAVPTIALLAGTITGQALALAVACKYRIASDEAVLCCDDIALGNWPEAELVGGIARRGGTSIALDMVISGEAVGAPRALDSGLVDRVATPSTWDAEAEALVVRGDPTVRRKELEEERSAILDAFRAKNGRRVRGDTMANAALAVLAHAMTDDAAAELAGSEEAAASRYLKRASRIAAVAPTGAVREIGSVAIIGAGTMGAGIALCFLDAGYPVTLVETSDEALARGVARIERLQASDMAKGRVSAGAAQAARHRLNPVTDLAAIGTADLIVEAVFEDIAVKTALFAKIDALAKPSAILASNTSFLDLDAIASATSRPASVMGLHFFSPANVMPLLEVVRTARTEPDLVATGMALGVGLGKIPVLVGACFGFVGNRMVAPRQREASLLVDEGVMPWQVDRALKAFGFAMGPFEMSDLAGLDLGWKPEESSSASLRDILCENGRFGQKSGAGYYDYDEKRQPRPSSEADRLIADYVARSGVTPRPASDAEIVDRCILPMVNEGAHILAEGIAQRASDIDVIWAKGYGWPPAKAGPMYYADSIGLPNVVLRLDALAAEHGEGFATAPLLRDLAQSGGSFTGCF